MVDETNCGSCGNACPSQVGCESGKCTGGPVASYWFEGDYTDHGSAGNTLTGSATPPVFAGGYSGKGISVNGQYAYLANATGLPAAATARTLEAWVDLAATLADATYNGILAYGTAGSCGNGQLLSMTSAYRVSSANWCNDLIEPVTGPATSNGRWSHVAYTFDGTKRVLYLNGAAVATDTPAAFKTTQNAGDWLRVATTDTPGRLWNGSIDEARIYDYARTPAQMLDDATLVARYWFDGANPSTDIGPNHLTATVTGATAVAGHLGNALSFDGKVTTLVSVPSLVALGVPNQAFSIEMWVKIASLPSSGAALASVSAGTGWCTPFLGIDPTGHPAAQVWSPASKGVSAVNVIPVGAWVHLAQTWSVANGLRLYVNGVLAASSGTINAYSASGAVDTMVLGNYALSTACSYSTVPNAPYTGLMDSVQVFSRERTAAEIAYDAAN